MNSSETLRPVVVGRRGSVEVDDCRGEDSRVNCERVTTLPGGVTDSVGTIKDSEDGGNDVSSMWGFKVDMAP